MELYERLIKHLTIYKWYTNNNTNLVELRFIIITRTTLLLYSVYARIY